MIWQIWRKNEKNKSQLSSYPEQPEVGNLLFSLTFEKKIKMDNHWISLMDIQN
jgi:hypothetical protein